MSKVSPSKEKKKKPLASRKSLQHFLSIDPKRRESLISSNHERTRKRRTAKNERKSSVLKSLVVLDIDDKDEDYLATSARSDDGSTHSRSSVDSSSTTGSGRRYMRRGSVTRHKLEADKVSIQPTDRSAADESDYGSDYDSGVDAAEKQRRRYLRRGSVTKHKLEADMKGMQPTQRAAGGAESDYGSDYDSGVDEAEKARRRYLRRGSVTKYSLDYTSGGAGMQPAEVAEEDAVMFKKAGTVVAKPRLPPPPSNDSFRLDDLIESPKSPAAKSASCHARIVSPEPPPKPSAKPTKKKRAGRVSRRGSMKMPAKQNLSSDYYSGNINDSGHQRKHLYFDSHEEALSPRQTKVPPASSDNTDRTSASLHSAASVRPAAAAPFHPIDPAKPRSGRKLIVDETELYSSCQDLDYSDHLETIAPETPFEQTRGFERAESASSFESEESSESTFCNDYEDDYESKMPAQPVSRKPRLPPTYSSAPKKLVGSSSTKKPSRRFSTRLSKGKIDTTGSVSSSADDSTISSTWSEEEASFHNNSTSNPVMNSYAGFSGSRRKSTVKQAPRTMTPTKTRGILCTDGKKAAQTTIKSVRFGRIVITEFPVILGDNPAVTSGAPVTIDWKPQGERNYSIHAYERCRPIRRRRRRLLISVSNRAILLLAAGYSIDDIADASINAQQIKFSRQESMNASQYSERVSLLVENTNDALNDMVQNTGKKLKALIRKPVQHSETARTA
ncbi:MAG: hypothetical protein SGILL_005173 [Bacillariaceae sp.]